MSLFSVFIYSKIAFCLILVSCFPALLQAQDTDYARQIITDLSSPGYHGRGYGQKGDKKAAAYIINELKKANVPALGKAYQQYFYIDVNTFPKTVNLTMNNKPLKAGLDFIINGDCPGIRGTFPLVCLDTTQEAFKTINPQEAFLIDTVGNGFFWKPLLPPLSKLRMPNSTPLVFIELVDKIPIYTPATKDDGSVYIKLKRSALPEDAETITLNIKNDCLRRYKTQNILAYLPGILDTFIVFTAHYDHLGHLGKDAYFPGANDNASSVAMLLDLAQHFEAMPDSLLKYSLAFFFFSAEEIGLKGSYHYVQKPRFPLDKIKYLINLDVIGSGDGGIKMVNASVYPDIYEPMVQINKEKHYVEAIKYRGEAANSDHFFFHTKGVPAVFIYSLGSYKEYHNIYDRVEDLPLYAYEGLFKLLIEFYQHKSQ